MEKIQNSLRNNNNNTVCFNLQNGINQKGIDDQVIDFLFVSCNII